MITRAHKYAWGDEDGFISEEYLGNLEQDEK